MSARHHQHYVRRDLRKRVPMEGGGFAIVPDGQEEALVEVFVDMAAIARRIGPKAMGLKSGVSKYMHGLVTVKVISRKRV